MSLFDLYWTEFLRDLLPWASSLFITASFLGSEYFFLVLIAIGYWTWDKQASKRVILLLLFSSVTNYWLKITLKKPRPPTSNWLPGTTASNYGPPSGHAQNSVTIWGWLGFQSRDKWRRFLYLLIILLVSFSRIYIGVHWLGDVLLGWIVGSVILGLYSVYESRILSIIEADFFNYSLLFFGLFSLAGSKFLSNIFDTNFGAIGGLMIGISVGFILESRYAKFEIIRSYSLWRYLFRVIFGLCFVFLVMIGFSIFIPSEIYWQRTINYALAAIIVIFIWPYLFTRLKI
jgi:membrane-associated phospholipid phosphatase